MCNEITTLAPFVSCFEDEEIKEEFILEEKKLITKKTEGLAQVFFDEQASIEAGKPSYRLYIENCKLLYPRSFSMKITQSDAGPLFIYDVIFSGTFKITIKRKENLFQICEENAEGTHYFYMDLRRKIKGLVKFECQGCYLYNAEPKKQSFDEARSKIKKLITNEFRLIKIAYNRHGLGVFGEYKKLETDGTRRSEKKFYWATIHDKELRPIECDFICNESKGTNIYLIKSADQFIDFSYYKKEAEYSLSINGESAEVIPIEMAQSFLEADS